MVRYHITFLIDENEPVKRKVKDRRERERDIGFIESFLRRKSQNTNVRVGCFR